LVERGIPGCYAASLIRIRPDTMRSMSGDSRAKRLADEGQAGPWTSVAGGIEWHRGPYSVSTDAGRLDLTGTTAFLSASPWAHDIPESIVRRAVEHSIAFGLYEDDRQVGFARVVTDRATFAWVGDVFVEESHRGRGLGLWLMRCVLAHPELQELRRWLLASTTAQGLYRRLGFTPISGPERFMEVVDMDVHRRQRDREAETAP
jgi:GNAT superfamily N-acetyltransferase